jgi:hypothetical protein
MANSNPFSIIKEMYGRIKRTYSWIGKGLSYNLYSKDISVDYSKTNYHLARAIFYASVVTVDGTDYGEDFLLGASFGKPIINSAAAFSFAREPEIFIQDKDIVDSPFPITVSDKEKEFNKILIDTWQDKYSSDIFKWARNTLRDGDQYMLINNDLTPTLIPPEQVNIIDDKITGEIIGYDVTTIIEEGESQPPKKIKYVAEYRKLSPFLTVKKSEADSVEESEIIFQEVGEDELEERELPIVEAHNEVDARERYGYSEYQNLYYLFSNYHSVFYEAIKGNIYDSVPATFFKGIENWDAWIKENGVYNDDTGQYELDWSREKTFSGGKDFSVDHAVAPSNSGNAKTILDLLFKLIVQSSETPEFVMGTAVKSSKASVSEQLPVALNKAQRKQKEFTKYYEKLYLTVLQIAERNGWSQVNSEVGINIKWPSLLEDDLTLNLEIVKFLSEQGLITDRVKMMLLNMPAKVDDIDEEIEEASKENKVKMKETIDNMPFPPGSEQDKQNPADELD